MNYPLISIVMATYNGEKFLREQIASLLDQTYPNLEIIISDDGSTDNTWDILRLYQHYPQMKISRNNVNLGFARNFEKAAMQANGTFIAFCDQDDIWMPEKITALYNAIGNHSLVYSNSILIDEQGNSLHKCLSDFRPLQHVYDVGSFAFFNVVSGHTMMVKKEVLQAALPLPRGIEYHDWYIAAEAAKQNGCFYLDKKLTFYRQHPQTCTKTIRCKKSRSRTRAIRYQHFTAKLKWLSLLIDNCQTAEKAFFETLYHHLIQNTKTAFNFPLFFFMLKNQEKLYKFTNKSWMSRVVDIRKLARGERAVTKHTGRGTFDIQFNKTATTHY